jgi:drug/metabolite transporter (DMT)-like permease
VLWASAFPAIRLGLQTYSPAHVALLRYLVASLALAGYALATRMPLPQRRDLPGLALLGFLGITVYNLALNTGEMQVPAATASFLVAAAPVLVALLAGLFLHERLSWRGWVGIGISFAGAGVIALAHGSGLALQPGALIVLLAAVAQSLYFVGQKPFLSRYSALQLTTYVIWAGTAYLLVFLPGLPAAVAAAPLSATLAVSYMGVFPGAVAYAAWGYGLARTPATQAASFLYLVPLFALAIAWVWLGEVPAPLALLGGGLVLVGVVVVNNRHRASAK